MPDHPLVRRAAVSWSSAPSKGGMSPAKCDALDYIQFLISAQTVYSNTEAARRDSCSEPERPAHDAYTRLLCRHPPDSAGLWTEVQSCITLNRGVLVLDDSTLDKPYARRWTW